MTNAEMKNKIKEQIDSIEKPDLLEEILYLIAFDQNDEEVFVIPEDHKKDIEISLAQKADGQTIPNSVAKQIIEKWLYR